MQSEEIVRQWLDKDIIEELFETAFSVQPDTRIYENQWDK
jgi:hypothetical protein